ncbi:MAG: response regulator [Candidatus Omnitrophica bacterium]|nr:response regulator [Candidatus Omnitrophota bacterium]
MPKNNITVLVVEDEVDFRTIMTFWLESKGYTVISASDGRTGVEMVKEKKPDVVFLDLNMFGMDGVQALKNIRKFDKDIPVIIISAHVGTSRANELMSLGVSGIFSKEDDFEKEFSLLEVILRKHNKLKERMQ